MVEARGSFCRLTSALLVFSRRARSALEFAHPVKRRLDPLLAFARGALLGRALAPIARRRIGFELGAQPFDPRRGRRCQLAQPLAPAEQTRAGGRAHPKPVLRQHVERHHTLFDQRRHHAGQQLIEHRGMRYPKSDSVWSFIDTPPHSQR